MASNAIHKLTEEEYLKLEESSEERHEFFNGEIFAMSGGTLTHPTLLSNLQAELVNKLAGGPCIAFGEGLKIHVNATGLNTYPDASVVCGKPILAPNRKDTLLNPMLVVEVLSPSSESYDRGKKFQHYRQIESLTDDILISQDSVRVEHFVRQADNFWQLRDYADLQGARTIESIGIEIPLANIYRQVEFENAESTPQRSE
jgi:Uma2 family endonuclease